MPTGGGGGSRKGGRREAPGSRAPTRPHLGPGLGDSRGLAGSGNPTPAQGPGSKADLQLSPQSLPPGCRAREGRPLAFSSVGGPPGVRCPLPLPPANPPPAARGPSPWRAAQPPPNPKQWGWGHRGQGGQWTGAARLRWDGSNGVSSWLQASASDLEPPEGSLLGTPTTGSERDCVLRLTPTWVPSGGSRGHAPPHSSAGECELRASPVQTDPRVWHTLHPSPAPPRTGAITSTSQCKGPRSGDCSLRLPRGCRSSSLHSCECGDLHGDPWASVREGRVLA